VKVREALAQCGLMPIDAQVLLAHVVLRDRAWLVAHRDDELPRAQADAFFSLAKRRRDGEPVAYLTGVKEFFGLPLAVSNAVLVPRPETETLVELALEWIAPDAQARVLDLGTGSGAVALAIAQARPQASVVATDVAEDALGVARGNARRLGIDNVRFARSDWFGAVEGSFDVVVSNPPYVAATDPHLAGVDVRFEPRGALVGGDDGLAALRTIVAGARTHLTGRGAIAVEHGHDQSAAVAALLGEAGFAGIVQRRDLAGIARVAGGFVATCR
jgi:release factor glutamine methyltransferase